MNNDTTWADGAPLERQVRPRAWAIFVDGGNARMWSTLQPHVQKLADAEGLEVTPLYDRAAIDAAVAAERERCAKLCEQVAAWLCRDGLREQAFGAFDCAGNIRLRGWPNAEVTGKPRTG